MKKAIIDINSKQYIVSENDVIKVDRLPRGEIKPKVLFLKDNGGCKIGTPEIKGVTVAFDVIKGDLDKKVPVRRFRAKSRYRKNRGHRQPIDILKIKKIEY